MRRTTTLYGDDIIVTCKEQTNLSNTSFPYSHVIDRNDMRPADASPSSVDDVRPDMLEDQWGPIRTVAGSFPSWRSVRDEGLCEGFTRIF